MREILFRGMRTDNGKWVDGYLYITHNGEHEISVYNDEVNIERWTHEVDPSTVGQYTGLKDKNGKRIFEGDIIKTRKSVTKTKKLKGYYGYDSDGYPQKIPGYDRISKYSYLTEIDCYAKVEYNQVKGMFYLNGGDKFVGAICNEVIGNITDNPELLEK